MEAMEPLLQWLFGAKEPPYPDRLQIARLLRPRHQSATIRTSQGNPHVRLRLLSPCRACCNACWLLRTSP